MNLRLCVALAILIGWAPAHSHVIVGNCNVVMSNVKVTGGTVKFSDMGCPEDPNKTLRVGYFWLDSNAASLLVNGVTHGALRDLVGARSIILQTGAYHALQDLLKRFGELFDVSNSYYLSVEVGRNGDYTDANRMDSQTLPKAALGRLRLYNGNNLINDYDETLASAYLGSSVVPQGHSIYMTQAAPLPTPLGTGARLAGDDVLNYAIVWRHIKRDHLQSYRARLTSLRDKLLKGDPNAVNELPHGLQTPIDPDVANRFEKESAGDHNKYARLLDTWFIRKLPDHALNASTAAMLYLTRDGWPDDFLQQLGYWEGHGGSYYYWEMSVPTRQLFLQIAVLENVGGSGAVFNLNGFRIQNATRTDLRTLENDKSETNEFLPYGPKVISKGDKVVIPLHLALRPHFAPREPSNEGTNKLKRDLKTLNPSANIVKVTQQFVGGPKTTVAKSVDSMLASISLPTPRTYRYGPRITLESLDIDGKSIPLRRYDPNNVYVVAGFEGGSCPTLSVKRADSRDEVRFGTILRRANGERNTLTEEINLGRDVVQVMLSEREPETTMIKELQVHRDATDGTSELVVNMRGEYPIQFGESMVVNIPRGPQGSTYRLQVTGYYDTFARLLESNYRDTRSATMSAEDVLGISIPPSPDDWAQLHRHDVLSQ